MSEHDPALPSSPQELEAAIAERRAHLAETVDELVQRARPKAIAQRWVQDVRTNLYQATHTDTGELRVERIAAISGAVVALLTVFTLTRRRLHRRSRHRSDRD